MNIADILEIEDAIKRNTERAARMRENLRRLCECEFLVESSFGCALPDIRRGDTIDLEVNGGVYPHRVWRITNAGRGSRRLDLVMVDTPDSAEAPGL